MYKDDIWTYDMSIRFVSQVSERAKPDKALESQFRTNVRDSKDDETMQNSIDAFKTNLESRVLMRSIELENCYITDRQERQVRHAVFILWDIEKKGDG